MTAHSAVQSYDTVMQSRDPQSYDNAAEDAHLQGLDPATLAMLPSSTSGLMGRPPGSYLHW